MPEPSETTTNKSGEAAATDYFSSKLLADIRPIPLLRAAPSDRIDEAMQIIFDEFRVDAAAFIGASFSSLPRSIYVGHSER
jgi:hypothetical protein